MLSINIPVFNVDVSELILSLKKQAENLAVPVEIRVFDDESEEGIKKINRIVCADNQVVYAEMEFNLGRAAIRNKMGLESNFQYILFIDADSAIPNPNYLERYLSECNEDIILCGGTCYSDSPPKNKEKLLRWVYGKKREAISASSRNEKKGFIITSNNFIISKKRFEKIRFREDIKGYGHEDTLLGYDLFKNGYEIKHVDNPVEHTGLEDGRIFLKKTLQAIDNLHFIANNLLGNDSDFANQMNFIKQYNKLTKIIPPRFIRFFHTAFSGYLEKNLTGKNPNLIFYDLYKLGWYSKIKSRG